MASVSRTRGAAVLPALARHRPRPPPVARCETSPLGLTRRLTTTAASSPSSSSPAVIDFGRGQPAPSLLPFGLLQNFAMPRLADDLGAFAAQGVSGCLGYGEGRGSKRFRARFAEFLAAQAGHPVDDESLFMTNGSSQGLQMVLDLFTSQGDTIFVEDYTYFLALNIFRGRGLNVVGVETDEQGIKVDDLEAKLATFGRHNKKPPVVYTIPSFGNPTGVTLSMERRLQLIDLSRRTQAKIVSDEVYQFLYFDELHRPPPSLFHIAQEQEGRDHNVIALNTFSKIMAPGLRLGWLQASEPLLKHIEEYGPIQSGGGLNPVVLLMVYHALEATDNRGHSLLAQHLDFLRRRYAHLSDTMCSALHASALPTAALRPSAAAAGDADSETRARRRGVCFDRPHGGYFVWLRLPDLPESAVASPSDAFVHACRERGVSYKPGHLFYSPHSPDGSTAVPQPSNATYARLSFAYYAPDEIVEGVRRLAGAIDHVVATSQ